MVDVDNAQKRTAYINLRKQKIETYKKKIIQYGAEYIYIDETMNLYATLLTFMKNRS